ncbi:glycosyltransferase family 2 protein [Castellaniella sp.]|uniref:glycosyltransferase family 2 protein n=1 Tax=Castellaniella sp. TaxID=1955812 RepID=UPI003C76D6BB
MLLSIIIISFNGEKYIGQAISSCLSLAELDHEIIVVDNGSTDGSLDLIRSIATGCRSAFRIIENHENKGPGEARNIGLEHASGEYCMFLDGDDWFEPEAIPRIVCRLQEWKPDVLMFNHQQVWPDGRKIPNVPNRYVDLGGQWADLTNPAVRKGAIRNLHVPWNKAYRMGFVRDHGLLFPRQTYYEDMVWSIRATVEAGAFYYIPDVLHNYRRHSQSSLHTTHDGHFNIIRECRRVEALLKDHADYRRWYGTKIYGYVRSTLFGVINTGSRIPKAREGDYLKDVSALLKDFRRMLGLWRPDILSLVAATGDSKMYSVVSGWAVRVNRLRAQIYKLRSRVFK